MKLIPYMIYINYNHHKNLLDDKSLPINQITIGEKLSYDESKKVWYTRNHYRDKVEFKDGRELIRFFQIGFKLMNSNSDKISIKFKSESSRDHFVLSYDDKNDIWYQKSKFVNRKKNGYYHYSQRTEDSLKGLSHSGQLRVNVYNDTQLILSEEVVFLPSSIEVSQYDLMISDLFRIRESLLKNEKIDVTVSTKKSETLDKLEKIVKNIEAPIRYINKFPSTSLVMEKDYIKENSIFRYDPLTEIQRQITPGKLKHKALFKREVPSNHENKIIKQQLEKIIKYSNSLVAEKKLVESYKTDIMNETQSIVQKSSERIKKCIDLNGGIHKIGNSVIDETLNDIVVNINTKNEEIKKRKIFLFNLLERNRLQNKEKIERGIPVKLNIKVFAKYFEKSADYLKGKLTVNIKSGKIPEDKRPSILFMGYEYLVGNKQWLNPQIKSIFCEISNSSITNREQLLLLKALDEAVGCGDKNEVGTNIQIKGFIINNNLNHWSKDIVGEPTKYPQYKSYKFDFSQIHSIIINGVEFMLPIPENEMIGELNDLLLSFDASVQKIQEQIEPLEMEKQTVFQLKRLCNNKEVIQLNAERYSNLAKKLETFLKLDMFKDTGDTLPEPLRPTQLFLHDPYYKKVWKSISDIEEEIGASLFPDKDRNNRFLGINSVDKIFEIWSLLKMISILIGKMGWKIKTNKTLIDFIDSYLVYKKELKGFVVDLELDNWLLEITYEAKVNFQGNEFSKEPDFRFLFKKNNRGHIQEIGVIYLDAKYRNYKEQGEQEWGNDIKEIAIKKYGSKTHKNKPLLKTIASFILHPDIAFGMDKEIKGENYFAFYNKKEFPVSMDNQSIEEVHKYGSIYLLPTATHSFKNWFRMIMEFRMNLHEKCWTCGNLTNIKKETKYTGRGYPKYHYQCQNHECNEYWVKNHCSKHGHKLVKHVNNYHRQPSSQYEWYVVCPSCGDGFQFEEPNKKMPFYLKNEYIYTE